MQNKSYIMVYRGVMRKQTINKGVRPQKMKTYDKKYKFIKERIVTGTNQKRETHLLLISLKEGKTNEFRTFYEDYDQFKSLVILMADLNTRISNIHYYRTVVKKSFREIDFLAKF